jgi:hypothetical protein
MIVRRHIVLQLRLGSSDRRINGQAVGTGLRCRSDQTRTAANSKTNVPSAPRRTRSACQAEAE